MKREMVKRLEKYSFEIVITGSVAVLLLLSLTGFLAVSLKFTLGVLVGGVVVILNHIGLYRSLKGLLSAASEKGVSETDEAKPVGRGGVLLTVFGFYLRIFLSGVIIYLALKGGWAMPIAIFVGASVIMITSFIVGMLLYKVD